MKLFIIKILWKSVKNIPRLHFLRRWVLKLYPESEIGKATVYPYTEFSVNVLLTLEDGCIIKPHVKVGTLNEDRRTRLIVGKNTIIMGGSVLDCTSHILIGSGSHIGRNTRLITHHHDHRKKETPVLNTPILKGSISIGSNVMIYDDVVVLRNVIIENNAIIGIRSVVVKNVPTNKVYAGYPARQAGERI